MVSKPTGKINGIVNVVLVLHFRDLFQISLNDFKYWDIYSTPEQMREGEKSCLYPPRFQVLCEQIDTSQSLHFSWKIFKQSEVNEKPCIFQLSRTLKVYCVTIHGACTLESMHVTS